MPQRFDLSGHKAPPTVDSPTPILPHARGAESVTVWHDQGRLYGFGRWAFRRSGALGTTRPTSNAARSAVDANRHECRSIFSADSADKRGELHTDERANLAAATAPSLPHSVRFSPPIERPRSIAPPVGRSFVLDRFTLNSRRFASFAGRLIHSLALAATVWVKQRAEVGRQRSEATKSSRFPLRSQRAMIRFDIPTDRAKTARSAIVGRSFVRD
jgi:hypothetical protein